MSGVAKDDSDPNSASSEPLAAKETAGTESQETWTLDEPRAKRAAPHLRVVGDDEEFAPPPAPEASSERIGAVIKATRENLGLTLEQVSREIRVHLSHLRAIEDMTPNLLGAPVYAKGYIRAYARHLGMDEMGTLERYLRECAILKDPEKQDIAPPATGRKLPTAVPVLGFLVLALAGAAGTFFLLNAKQEPAAPASAAASSPAAAPPAPGLLAETAPAPVVAGPQLTIVAVKPGHLEVRTASGDKMIDRDLLPGELRVPRVGHGWTVSASDGSAFEWRLGDQSLGLMGPGGPVNLQSVDMAAKRQPVAPPVVETAAPTTDATTTTTIATTTPPTGAPAVSTPATTAAAPPPAPRPAATRPRPQPPAAPAQTQPAEQPPATASAAPVQAPSTPPRDPALAAYPDQ
jgi:hypothetical protein